MSIELKQALNRVRISRKIWRDSNPSDVQAVKSAYGLYKTNVQAYKAMQRQEAQRAKEQ